MRFQFLCQKQKKQKITKQCCDIAIPDCSHCFGRLLEPFLVSGKWFCHIHSEINQASGTIHTKKILSLLKQSKLGRPFNLVKIKTSDELFQ